MEQSQDVKPGSLTRRVRRHLWHVVYDTIFESSSGMDRYSIPHEKLEGYVATTASCVNDVEREIAATLDNQSRVTRIHTATWLGEMLNAV